MAQTTLITPQTAYSAWDPRLSGDLKPSGQGAEDDVKLKKTCQEMEGVFLNLLLKSMRATVPKNTLDGQSNHSDTLLSMMDMEMTRNLAAAGGTGLADMMYRNIKLHSAPTQYDAASQTAQPSR